MTEYIVEPADLGQLLRTLRKEANMPLRELAAAGGVSAAAVSYYERGRTEMKAAVAEKIFQALGYSVKMLVARR